MLLNGSIELEAVSKLDCGRDAAVELIRMYLQRVLKITFSSTRPISIANAYACKNLSRREIYIHGGWAFENYVFGVPILPCSGLRF
jgi:hypothetical protein